MSASLAMPGDPSAFTSAAGSVHSLGARRNPGGGGGASGVEAVPLEPVFRQTPPGTPSFERMKSSRPSPSRSANCVPYDLGSDAGGVSSGGRSMRAGRAYHAAGLQENPPPRHSKSNDLRQFVWLLEPVTQ